MREAERQTPICPRCGKPLHRERRHAIHRLLSIAYPVRYYGCSRACGWTGILPAVSRLKTRKRRLLRVAVILLLALGGLAIAVHLAPYWHNQGTDESLEESDTSE